MGVGPVEGTPRTGSSPSNQGPSILGNDSVLYEVKGNKKKGNKKKGNKKKGKGKKGGAKKKGKGKKKGPGKKAGTKKGGKRGGPKRAGAKKPGGGKKAGGKKPGAGRKDRRAGGKGRRPGGPGAKDRRAGAKDRRAGGKDRRGGPGARDRKDAAAKKDKRDKRDAARDRRRDKRDKRDVARDNRRDKRDRARDRRDRRDRRDVARDRQRDKRDKRDFARDNRRDKRDRARDRRDRRDVARDRARDRRDRRDVARDRARDKRDRRDVARDNRRDKRDRARDRRDRRDRRDVARDRRRDKRDRRDVARDNRRDKRDRARDRRDRRRRDRESRLDPDKKRRLKDHRDRRHRKDLAARRRPRRDPRRGHHRGHRIDPRRRWPGNLTVNERNIVNNIARNNVEVNNIINRRGWRVDAKNLAAVRRLLPTLPVNQRIALSKVISQSVFMNSSTWQQVFNLSTNWNTRQQTWVNRVLAGQVVGDPAINFFQNQLDAASDPRVRIALAGLIRQAEYVNYVAAWQRWLPGYIGFGRTALAGGLVFPGAPVPYPVCPTVFCPNEAGPGGVALTITPSEGELSVNASDPLVDVGSAGEEEERPAGSHIRVVNDTKQKITVYLQYHTEDADGKEAWFPGEPDGNPDNALVYDLDPGETLELQDDDWTIVADRARIWAKGANGRTWEQFRTKDLPLVLGRDADGDDDNIPGIPTFDFTVR
jgi:hypothetical protein